MRPKLKDKEGAKQDILDLLQDPASGCQGTGIVYCMSQKDCEVRRVLWDCAMEGEK